MLLLSEEMRYGLLRNILNTKLFLTGIFLPKSAVVLFYFHFNSLAKSFTCLIIIIIN